MAVLEKDFRRGSRCESNFASKLTRLRISSSHPRIFRTKDLNDNIDLQDGIMNIEQIKPNFPSFQVGPCQLQEKPRQIKSAQLSVSLRHLAFSLRSARFRKRERKQFESVPCEGDEHDSENTIDDVHKESNNLNFDSDITEDAAAHQVNSTQIHTNSPEAEPTLEDTTGSNEIADLNSNEGSSKKRILKRVKSGKKKKTRCKSGKGESKKKQASKFGKLKISRWEEDRRAATADQLLAATSVKKMKNNSKAPLSLPKQSKSLPTIDPRVQCSPSKSNDSLSDVDEYGSANALCGQGSSQRTTPPRCSKVFLSEKHSGTVMGIPAVPPGTPGLELQKEIEWVPSLSDVKSQRAIAVKLSNIVAKQCKKDKQERMIKEQRLQENEKKRLREMQARLKQRQRSEIYALNRILTEVENETFEKLRLERGMPV